jgi:hypothetical protein
LKGQCLFESYPHGVESGEILAQRPPGWSGAARRAKSRSSRSTLWITPANGLSASPFQS